MPPRRRPDREEMTPPSIEMIEILEEEEAYAATTSHITSTARSAIDQQPRHFAPSSSYASRDVAYGYLRAWLLLGDLII